MTSDELDEILRRAAAYAAAKAAAHEVETLDAIGTYHRARDDFARASMDVDAIAALCAELRRARGIEAVARDIAAWFDEMGWEGREARGLVERLGAALATGGAAEGG